MRFWFRLAQQRRVFAVVGICFAVSTSFAMFEHPAAGTPRKSAPAAVRVKPEAVAVTSLAKATPFEIEQRMSAAALITRWDPDIARPPGAFACRRPGFMR